MASAQNAARIGTGTETGFNTQFIVPTVFDTINKSSWVVRRTMSNPKPWDGKLIQENIITANSTQGQSFKGTETFTTSVEFASTSMNWFSTGYAQPVTISMVERGLNQTPSGKINLYKASYEFAQNSMTNALGGILYAFGLGNDFDGLGLIVDDGTNAANYGGLSRTTYATNINCGGSTGIIAATGGVIDLATMDSADDAATVSGLVSETPGAVLTTRAVWSLYGQLFEATKLATYNALGGSNIKPGDSGFGQNAGAASNLVTGSSNITYRGKEMYRDDKCTSGVMFFLNENYLNFYSLTIPGLQTVRVANSVTEGVFDKQAPTAFQWRDLMSPVNQLAETGIFVVYGQLMHKMPNRNEKITGITTI